MAKQLTQKSEIEMLVEISRNMVGKVQDHEDRITTIEKTMICDSRKRLNIKRRAESHVTTILGGKGTERYKTEYQTTIRSLWRDYWNTFGVTSYHDTPAMLYDQAIQFIDDWRPLKLAGLEETMPEGA